MTEKSEKEVWQERCTAEFDKFLDGPNHAESRASWAQARDALIAEAKSFNNKRQVVIGKWFPGETYLDDRDLSGLDLRYCYLARLKFARCNLEGTRFDRCILSGCSFTYSNVAHAVFLGSHADEKTSFKYNTGIDTADLNLITSADSLRNFDPEVVGRLRASQNVDAFRRSSRDPVAWVANLLTDFGRGIWRLAAVSGLIILAFATLYNVVYNASPRIPGTPARSFGEFLIVSGQRFVNAPPAFVTSKPILEVLYLSEACFGYLALALLVAVLVNKLVKT